MRKILRSFFANLYFVVLIGTTALHIKYSKVYKCGRRKTHFYIFLRIILHKIDELPNFQFVYFRIKKYFKQKFIPRR